MTEVTETNVPEEPLRLVDPGTVEASRLYRMARMEPLFQAFVPDIIDQMRVEEQINENFPREEKDGDATRILINYTNPRGNSILFALNDTQRLARKFDVDHFIGEYVKALGGETLPDDPVQNVMTTCLAALSHSTSTLLGLTTDVPTERTKLLMETVIQSLTSVIFDDALDIVISLVDSAVEDGNPVQAVHSIWAVKLRDNQKITEVIPYVNPYLEENQAVSTRYSTHPGDLLKYEVLLTRNLTAEDFAKILEIPQEQSDLILSGEAPLTREQSAQIEEKTGFPADMLNRLMDAYNEAKLRREEEEHPDEPLTADPDPAA